MISRPSVLFLASFSLSVSAFAVYIAPVTSVPQPYGVLSQLSVPEPTEAPNVHELRRGQNAQKTLIAAPDNTCGFFNGSSGKVHFFQLIFHISICFHFLTTVIDQPWGCSTGNCFFETMTLLAVNSVQIGANDTQTVAASTSTKVGSVLCCDSKTGCPSAPAPTACVDLGRNDYNKTCTGSCPTDSATLKWCVSCWVVYSKLTEIQAHQASTAIATQSRFKTLISRLTFAIISLPTLYFPLRLPSPAKLAAHSRPPLLNLPSLQLRPPSTHPQQQAPLYHQLQRLPPVPRSQSTKAPLLEG